MTRPHVTLRDFAAFCLNLDDDAMLAEMRLDRVPSPKGMTRLEGEPDRIALVLGDLLSRSNVDSGWDQPPEAYRACRAAYPRARAEVEAQGYSVAVGQYGGVTLRATR